MGIARKRTRGTGSVIATTNGTFAAQFTDGDKAIHRHVPEQVGSREGTRRGLRWSDVETIIDDRDGPS